MITLKSRELMLDDLVMFNGMLVISLLGYFYSADLLETRLARFLVDSRMKILVGFGIGNAAFFWFGRGIGTEGMLLLLLLLLLLVASIIDIQTGLISDNLNIFTFVSGVFYLYYSSSLDVFMGGVMWAFVVVGVFTFIRFISTIFFGRELLGEGDFFPLSLFVLIFGIKLGIFMLLLAFAMTLPVFVLFQLLDSEGGREVPFIPFIFLSILSGVTARNEFEDALSWVLKVFI